MKNISPVTYSRFSSFQTQQDPATANANGPLTGINPDNFDYYNSLRIYQNHSWFELGNLLVMTTMCSNQFFVENCHRIYELTKKVFGASFPNHMIANSIGRIFTAGDTLATMDKFMREWKYPQVNLLIGYSNEIPPGQPALVEDLDESARIFAETVDLAVKDMRGHSGMAIKCSCLIPPPVMKKANESQLRIRGIFSQGYGDLDQTLTARQIADRLKENNVQFTQEEFQEFMSEFLSKGVTADNLDQITVTKFEWLRDMNMFYVENSHKNVNKILIQLTQLNDSDLIELEHYSRRLKLVFDRAAPSKTPVLVDAEQSYYQETIDVFAFQYMAIYNKGDKAFILNTYQNYLKSTKDKLAFELRRCKSLGTPLGAKMVRGAYMVEEKYLAKQYSCECPIQNCIDDTHNNYNSNIEFLFTNWIQGSHVIVASHNERTVTLAKDLVRRLDINSKRGNVTFGQLLGLGDHLTFSLANQGFTVAKYVAFGPVPILIPFFVRRAQETKQMFQSTGLQRSLAVNEILYRMKPKKKEL